MVFPNYLILRCISFISFLLKIIDNRIDSQKDSYSRTKGKIFGYQINSYGPVGLFGMHFKYRIKSKNCRLLAKNCIIYINQRSHALIYVFLILSAEGRKDACIRTLLSIAEGAYF